MRGTDEPRNIVIFRTDRIGEVLLSTVAIDALKEKYPDCRISFVTSLYSGPLIEARNDVEEVITYETMGGRGSLLSAAGLALKLRGRRFDAAMVLNPHRALHAACFLAGIPVRAGYGRKWGFLLNRTIKDERDKGEKHETEYALDVTSLLTGKPALPRRPALSVDPGDRKKLLTGLRSLGVDTARKFIAVHPGSSNAAKVWPREMYAKAISGLKNELTDGYEVFIIGTNNETPLAKEIIELTGGGPVDLTGRFSLKELMMFLSICEVFIGNDTGPMHIAAALDTPVVAIFGRNIPGVGPVRWGPLGEHNIIFHEKPGCDPCYDTTCPYGYKCLRRIEPEAVVEAVKKILEGKGDIRRG